MLKEAIELEEQVPAVSMTWRASEVGECEAYLCHVRLGHGPLAMAGRVRHLLDDGVTHEHDVINRLRGAGIKVLNSYVEGQVEVQCSLVPFVTGHPDGVLDIPRLRRKLELDYADEGFKFSRFMLLEVTAPNHFTFLRLKRSHMREILWRKFVQIQMYLVSEEMRSYGDCCVVIAKNKNTSELYEEGVLLCQDVVAKTLEKLKWVEELTSQGKVSGFRCSDWRRGYCRYRHLCYGTEEEVVPVDGSVLRGESLSEAAELREAALAWQKGKQLRSEGEGLIADSREQFAWTLKQYGCRGLTVQGVKAMLVDAGTNRRTDYDLLRQKYPAVHDEVVAESIRESYVRVSE